LETCEEKKHDAFGTTERGNYTSWLAGVSKTVISLSQELGDGLAEMLSLAFTKPEYRVTQALIEIPLSCMYMLS